jgi:hypothetical protein
MKVLRRNLANVPGPFQPSSIEQYPNKYKEEVAEKLREGFKDELKMAKLAKQLLKKRYSKSAETIERFSQDI